MMAPRPFHTIGLTRINTLLSTRLHTLSPRLNGPAALPPTPEFTSALPPLQTTPTTYPEEEEEMAAALRQDIAASFDPFPNPFGFLPQPAPGPAALPVPRLMTPLAAATPDGSDYACEHCGKTFMSPYAVNGHKTHSKVSSAKARKAKGLGPGA
jgi:hypothetical protein